MLVFLETLIRLRGDAQGFLLQRLRGVFADFVAHTYPALVNLKKKKLKKAIKLVIRSYKTLKVSEGFLSFESSARRAPSAFQACNRDTIKNKTLEALKIAPSTWKHSHQSLWLLVARELPIPFAWNRRMQVVAVV